MVGVAVNVTFCPAQIEVAEAAIVTSGTTDGLTAIVIAFEFTVDAPLHPLVEVNWQVTISPFAKVVEAKLELFVPAFEPFTFH